MMSTRGFLAAIAVLACACGPSVPAQVTYRVLIEDGEALQGVAVSRDGTVVGTLSAVGAIELASPSSVRPSALHLVLGVPTQCGERSVPVELQLAPDADSDEAIARSSENGGVVLVNARATLGSLARVTVLVDRGADARPLRVGEATLSTDAQQVTLFVGDCGTEAPVRAGDEVLGTWRASSVATFVSMEPVCHRFSRIGFGDAVTGPPAVFGPRARALPAVPEYFLTPAPSSLTARGDARYVTELVRTECPSAPPAEVAAGAFEHGGCLQALPSLRRAVAFDQDDIDSAVRFVGCLSVEREAREAAHATLALHPEARERLSEALRTAGHEAAASAL